MSDKKPKEIYVRRVKNGLILNTDEGIMVFTDEKKYAEEVGRMFVPPRTVEKEYKFTITLS